LRARRRGAVVSGDRDVVNLTLLTKVAASHVATSAAHYPTFDHPKYRGSRSGEDLVCRELVVTSTIRAIHGGRRWDGAPRYWTTVASRYAHAYQVQRMTGTDGL